MTIRAILWDLDGTLADTTALHYQAWRMTMQRYGVDLTYESFIKDYGRNNAEILAEHFGIHAVATIQQVADEKESAFRSLITPGVLQPLPGALAWLHCFRSLGMIQVIGSSGPMANIAAVVHALGVGDFFFGLVSGVHLPEGKPEPTIFLRCAALAGAAPDECLVIEDSLHGIEAAMRAGMTSVAVGRIAAQPALQDLIQKNPGLRCIVTPSLASIDDPKSILT
ncbi:HAD family phosphatase [Caldilinea sp.]|jgi:beta-phosphoglucomutase|uniref:HAD family hydrolase n=1 Tax=Caldilinea sp. TaxID=2293560 RepID=UPI001B2ACFEA|nr:HAD family phosphatase [Caldilinea sp.]MBO9393151.1 HAD family phosphatase [Caldilinea sp.]